MKKSILLTFIILLYPSYIFAQGAIWLLIPPSAALNGMGEIGVCLPERDPVASHSNPANGLLSYQGTSVVHSSMDTPWLKNLASDVYLHHSYIGLNIIPDKYPFQIVFNKQNTILDLGEHTAIDSYGNYIGEYTSQMSSDVSSIAARYYDKLWLIPFDIALGFSRKRAIQNLVPDEYLEEGSGTSKNTFYDYGVLASSPINLYDNKTWQLSLSPAFGYSLSNIGDSIVFIKPQNADPTPRTVRTGLSISAKIALDDGWNLFEYRGGRSAYDILFKSVQPIRYQSSLGDINFFKNIIQSKSDSSISVSRGHEISFLNIYSFRFGRFIDLTGHINEYSTGYGINSAGIVQLVSHIAEVPELLMINQFLTIEYNYAKWTDEYGHPRDDTEFDAYIISIRNIDKIVKRILSKNNGLLSGSPPISSLNILTGINLSTMIFNNKDTRKSADVKFGTGLDFGIETKVKSIITGISFTQNVANYSYKIDLDDFTYETKLKDNFNFLTVYGLYPRSVSEFVRLFGGAQIANCISRTITVDNISDSINSIDTRMNYGILGGFDLIFKSKIGMRVSYNYWFQRFKNGLYEKDKFHINGIRINLIVNL